MRTLGRYLLLQTPGLLLTGLVLLLLWEWADLSGRLAWLLFTLWIAKEAIVFPFVRRAYEPEGTGAERLIGETGVVQRSLDPRGYVQVRGELWRAEVAAGARPIPAGALVTVIGAHRLTVTVAPAEGDAK